MIRSTDNPLIPAVWIACTLLAGCGGSGKNSAADPPAKADTEQSAAAAAVEPFEPSAELQAVLEQLATLQAQHKYEEGVALAQDYLASHPQSRRVHYALAIFHGSANNHLGARRAFETELAIDPRHVDSLRGLATALGHLGELEEAAATLRRAAELAPGHAGVAAELGKALSDLGRLDEAESQLRRSVENGGGAAAHAELGLLYRRRGEPEAAAHAFRQALAAEPTHAAALSNLGQVLVQLGREAEGRALLERHAELATLRDQLDLYQRSSALAGASAENFIRLAELQVRLGQETQAASSYTRALEIDPDRTTASLGLAALFLKDGQTKEATKWTVHALMQDPESSKAHFMLGLLRLGRDQVEEARKSFETSRQHRRWDAETCLHAADAFHRHGQLADAEAAYRQIVELAPECEKGASPRGETP